MDQYIKRKTAKFLVDESGPTAVEYAVMLALLVGVMIASIGVLASSSSGLWTNNTDQIETFIGSN